MPTDENIATEINRQELEEFRLRMIQHESNCIFELHYNYILDDSWFNSVLKIPKYKVNKWEVTYIGREDEKK